MSTLAGLRALSLYQPYASGVALGFKRNETRDWPWPSTVPLPARVLVCSTARTPEAVRLKARLFVLAACSSEQQRIDAEFLHPANRAHGVALCVVDVLACRPIEEVRDELRALAGEDSPRDVRRAASLELALGDYRDGRFAFELANVRRLSSPVPVKGLQKLWTPSPSIVAEVERQLAEAARA